MEATIQYWGDSQGLRLPKRLFEEAHLSVGDEVTLSVKDGKVAKWQENSTHKGR